VLNWCPSLSFSSTEANGLNEAVIGSGMGERLEHDLGAGCNKLGVCFFRVRSEEENSKIGNNKNKCMGKSYVLKAIGKVLSRVSYICYGRKQYYIHGLLIKMPQALVVRVSLSSSHVRLEGVEGKPNSTIETPSLERFFLREVYCMPEDADRDRLSCEIRSVAS